MYVYEYVKLTPWGARLQQHRFGPTGRLFVVANPAAPSPIGCATLTSQHLFVVQHLTHSTYWLYNT